ncbi:MAG: hypothetical protein RIB43_06585 [Rhodospirillaceae bacterium]
MHESLLIYRNLRYLKVSLLLVIITGALYVMHSPVGSPNGGTWLGYTLGVIAAGIMIWLAWYGVRRRAYGNAAIRMEDWASAHIYLGVALVVVSTFHSGFQFGINIHTLLYFLMLIVVLSGAVGLYFYMRFPRLLSENRRGLTTEMMLSQIAELDRELNSIALKVEDQTGQAALNAVQNTIIGGNLFQQLSINHPDCATRKARKLIEQSDGSSDEATRRKLLTRLTKKEGLLRRIRQDIRLRCLLKIWLYVHVPFTFATLAALIAHVVVVFYYW